MRLTVHIGTTKTGTSTIQAFLQQNRDALRADGILVPTCLGDPIHYHAALASLPFGKSTDLARLIPITNTQQHTDFRERTRANFHDEVAAADGCREVIITAEQLQSRLPQVEHVATFQELFCSQFDEVRVIVYVRPQLDQIISLYSTVLRTGYSDTLRSFIRSRMKPAIRPYFDLRDVITRWTNTFGEEQVIVRPYKALTADRGTLGDFATILGLDLRAENWTLGGPANTSINVQGQNLLRMLNEGTSMDAGVRRKVVEWTESNCPGVGAMPPLRLAKNFHSLFTDSNAWVIENYFPDHPEYLEPRWPAPPTPTVEGK